MSTVAISVDRKRDDKLLFPRTESTPGGYPTIEAAAMQYQQNESVHRWTVRDVLSPSCAYPLIIKPLILPLPVTTDRFLCLPIAFRPSSHYPPVSASIIPSIPFEKTHSITVYPLSFYLPFLGIYTPCPPSAFFLGVILDGNPVHSRTLMDAFISVYPYVQQDYGVLDPVQVNMQCRSLA